MDQDSSNDNGENRVFTSNVSNLTGNTWIGGSSQIVLSEQEPSKWWGYGLGIVMIFLALGSFANVVAASFIDADSMRQLMEPYNIDHPGDYPENGTSVEQQQYNDSLVHWETMERTYEMIDALEDSGILKVSMYSNVVLFFLAIPIIYLGFANSEHMAKPAWIYLAVHATSQSYLGFKSAKLVTEVMDGIPGMEDWMAYSNVGSALFCDVILAALLALLMMETRKDATKEMLDDSPFNKPQVHEQE